MNQQLTDCGIREYRFGDCRIDRLARNAAASACLDDWRPIIDRMLGHADEGNLEHMMSAKKSPIWRPIATVRPRKASNGE